MYVTVAGVSVTATNASTIQARSGTDYVPSSLVYDAGTTYHFRLVADIRTHKYAFYVTPAGGTNPPARKLRSTAGGIVPRKGA